MSKPWGGTGIGSWAAEAERAEEEESAAAAAAAAATANPQSFPTLKEGVSAKPKKKKMTLSEFNIYSSSGSGSTRLTHDEMLQLPTGPKQRSADELYSGGTRLGGGFSNYGGGPPSRRGFDDDRGGPGSRGPPPRRNSDFEMQASRADEVDNWAAGKRAIVPPIDSGGRSSRYGSLGGGGGGGSRADEVDNWNFGKKASNPTPPPVGRSSTFGSSTFGSGFRDSGSSDWRRDGGGGEMGGGGRPRLVLDRPSGGGGVGNNNEGGGGAPSPPVVVVKTNKSNPFGAARPREDVLAEKGLDWKKLDLEIEAKKGSSRPTSSQGSRPTSSQSNRSESVGGGGGSEVVVVKARPKVNPFGDAKPREVLLEEKGMDWRKIDLELERRRIDRPETEEEKALKEEIENLKKELEKESGNEVPQGSSEGDQTSLRDIIQSKEKDLEALVRELDDKVRFGQKAVERPGSGAGRPGSGAGRFGGFPERPPSQSGGSFEDNARGVEPMDRPRSRGTGGGDVWTRPGEDRRGGFHGSRDRGFLSNRDFGRSRSRERW